MFVCGLVWPKMSQVAWPMARTQRAGRDKFYERADWLWSPLCSPLQHGSFILG